MRFFKIRFKKNKTVNIDKNAIKPFLCLHNSFGVSQFLQHSEWTNWFDVLDFYQGRIKNEMNNNKLLIMVI